MGERGYLFKESVGTLISGLNKDVGWVECIQSSSSALNVRMSAMLPILLKDNNTLCIF